MLVFSLGAAMAQIEIIEKAGDKTIYCAQRPDQRC
jgi:hypothetical protein